MAAKRGHARPAGVVEHITRKRIASELGRSRVRPEQFRYWSASGRENRKPMMNERGKSDPAVVAAKLANKAERSAAEPVEPRAGTKGNANQQHSGRTQSRETVSQVLARIRQTARERKKERFTALFHHINVELLRDAFFAIRREAAPGVDGVTWQDYATNVEINLQGLHARVQRGAYRALRPGDSTYPSRTAGNARSRSPPWKTRLSNGRRPHCSTRSTRKTSSASRTVSGPDAARTTRWMRSWLESGAGR